MQPSHQRKYTENSNGQCREKRRGPLSRRRSSGTKPLYNKQLGGLALRSPLCQHQPSPLPLTLQHLSCSPESPSTATTSGCVPAVSHAVVEGELILHASTSYQPAPRRIGASVSILRRCSDLSGASSLFDYCRSLLRPRKRCHDRPSSRAASRACRKASPPTTAPCRPLRRPSSATMPSATSSRR